MTTYLGNEVLTSRPHRGGPIEERVGRSLSVIEPAAGIVALAPRSATGVGSTSYVFEALSRTEVAELREFFDRQEGSTRPFWVPSYQSDLTLTADVALNASSIAVIDNGYADQLWPGTGARRHVALYTPALTLSLVKVTNAVGGTLTITPNMPAAHTAQRSVVSFLRLVRFDGPIEFLWHSCWVATATIAVRELPMEAPL